MTCPGLKLNYHIPKLGNHIKQIGGALFVPRGDCGTETAGQIKPRKDVGGLISTKGRNVQTGRRSLWASSRALR
ncbi:unnamed protein product [Bursaphelenchus okinawaensis]|uniref:Uncharacterized protein n=1 Tax=Bursaphelenchus okinawaensis TaxID=465554 RepID=A0A811JUA9_9BILA|nr:unnamed protein product [Bursaphelenchus okinawaensis]CAG9083884.1 unnamed protein product [Bursaphelenchus okinawaensis]